ncbi:hypothetical protein LCGC14_1937900 [marine sediment metagenome]|uniref:Uncharacterized protein n=1 Tax=marine sediment metagenome TaxID=412755 RepID=A0A0F9HZN5_9ZZZZ
MNRPKVDHIGKDTVKCLTCQHHHCALCPICHRCGCGRDPRQPNQHYCVGMSLVPGSPSNCETCGPDKDD